MTFNYNEPFPEFDEDEVAHQFTGLPEGELLLVEPIIGGVSVACHDEVEGGHSVNWYSTAEAKELHRKLGEWVESQ